MAPPEPVNESACLTGTMPNTVIFLQKNSDKTCLAWAEYLASNLPVRGDALQRNGDRRTGPRAIAKIAAWLFTSSSVACGTERKSGRTARFLGKCGGHSS